MTERLKKLELILKESKMGNSKKALGAIQSREGRAFGFTMAVAEALLIENKVKVDNSFNRNQALSDAISGCVDAVTREKLLDKREEMDKARGSEGPVGLQEPSLSLHKDVFFKLLSEDQKKCILKKYNPKKSLEEARKDPLHLDFDFINPLSSYDFESDDDYINLLKKIRDYMYLLDTESISISGEQIGELAKTDANAAYELVLAGYLDHDHFTGPGGNMHRDEQLRLKKHLGKTLEVALDDGEKILELTRDDNIGNTTVDWNLGEGWESGELWVYYAPLVRELKKWHKKLEKLKKGSGKKKMPKLLTEGGNMNDELIKLSKYLYSKGYKVESNYLNSIIKNSSKYRSDATHHDSRVGVIQRDQGESITWNSTQYGKAIGELLDLGQEKSYEINGKEFSYVYTRNKQVKSPKSGNHSVTAIRLIDPELGTYEASHSHSGAFHNPVKELYEFKPSKSNKTEEKSKAEFASFARGFLQKIKKSHPNDTNLETLISIFIR